MISKKLLIKIQKLEKEISIKQFHTNPCSIINLNH